ncbi:response regulator transcription factor [Paenibacillus crassostreae]|uniref:PhoP family transcriptional regulator n=1 Tax=Paenibacillus crassostreae TaxID=1763538 RepID=A0A167FCW2_9BACL|nr:response regulator transcription factor [Paenibacillus crassostreae]AOZ90812.1 DNA-binding response regulator [Paenibacillus crassostreae]OAB76422.1 PhoP family transcriptional regulator [Paenibacillus crassostreae]
MSKRILIVEDDVSIAELQKDYLQISGFEVTIVEDGNRCLSLMEREHYDLIILDIMLPGKDGFEVLNVIREKEDIPVLLVSARAEEIYKIKGLGLGADDYITKPFSAAELVARVQAHVKKYERLAERFSQQAPDDEYLYKRNMITARGLTIDTDARQVFVNGKEVVLPQKEYDLLLFLMQNANRVFNKDELFERIWGIDALGDVTTVTVHIARIREKIEEQPSKPEYINTVWGAGYRFMV